MKQFIERNPVVIGVLTAIFAAAVLVAALTVTREDLAGGYELTAEFVDANGLRPGDLVQVAGIRAGRVLGIDIVDDHVEARLQIEGDVELPVQTRAEIILRTLVGKRAVELETGDDFSLLLAEGDVIPLERTRVAIDVPAFGDEAEGLLSEIDSEALNTFLVALADVTRDQNQEVAELIDAGSDLADVITSQETEIRTLLRNLASVSGTLNTRDDELVAIIDDLDTASAALNARRADLQRLLRETARAGGETADLIRDTRGELDAILDELHLDTAIVNRHQMDIAEALAYSGDAVYGFSDIAWAGEVPVPWGHVLVTSLGPVGVDVLLGCGGLLDSVLDDVLGPDPRPCSEQDHDTFPDDVEERPGPEDHLPDLPQLPVPELPDVPLPLAGEEPPIVLAPQRHGIDLGPRTLLQGLEDGS